MSENALKFFTDIHISLKAINELREKGLDILRSIEAGFDHNTDDKVLLAFATEHERIIITCDEGFERYHAEYVESGKEHAGIVYFSMSKGWCKNRRLIVNEISFLYEAADYKKDLYNQIWRVKP